MKKFFRIMLSLCFLSIILYGCGEKEEEKPKTIDRSAEVTMWGYWDGDIADQINEIVSDFNSRTGSNVKYVAQSDMMNAFQAAAIAGDVPDIMLWDATEVRRYARLGQLKSIDDYLSAEGIGKEAFNDEAIRELTVEGKLYGLPMNIDIWGIYVNMDILNKAGIEAPPSSWDELREAAVAAMKVDGVAAGINMKFAPNLFNSFLVANGGKPLSEDGKTVNLDEKALQVLDYFKELIDAGVYTPQYTPSNGSDGFLSGEEAMAFWPTSMLRTYKAYGDEMDFTFMPIPKGRADGAKSGGVQTSWCLVIPAASKQSPIAEEFLAFALHDADNSLKWCDIVGGFSTLKSVQNDEKFSNDKYLKNVLADLDNHQIRADVPGFINLEDSCYIPEIQKMFEGGQSPEDTLKIMTEEGNKLLAQYRNDND